MSNSTKAVHIKQSDNTVVPSTFFADNAAAVADAVAAFSQQILGGEVVAIGSVVSASSGAQPFLIVPHACTLKEVRIAFGDTPGTGGATVLVQRVNRAGESYDTSTQVLKSVAAFGDTTHLIYRFQPNPAGVDLLPGDQITVGWGEGGAMGCHGLAVYLFVQQVPDALTLITF